MGNICICENKASPDYQVLTNHKTINLNEEKSDIFFNKTSATLWQYSDVVVIQCVLRGFMDRKFVNEIVQNTSVNLLESEPSTHKNKQTTALTVIPDYANPLSLAAEEKIGKFEYSAIQDTETLITKGPVLLENKTIYIGS